MSSCPALSSTDVCAAEYPVAGRTPMGQGVSVPRQSNVVLELLMRALVAWSPSLELGSEIAHSNRTSRTWHARIGDRRAVVKLTFDGQPFVEPGLRVAAHVQAATGVPTGAPIPTLSGQVTVPVTVHGSVETLAVLEHVAGRPVGCFDVALARGAGLLLARVHACLSADAPAVPAGTLDWFEQHSSQRDAVAAAKEVNALVRTGALTVGVLYGDPSPELLLGDAGDLRLIDWGTPSRGPFLYDVATWLGHIERHGDAAAAAYFLRAYRSVSRLKDAEFDAFDLCRVLWRSLLAGGN